VGGQRRESVCDQSSKGDRIPYADPATDTRGGRATVTSTGKDYEKAPLWWNSDMTE
jgi:hypothetical protein